MHSNSGDGLIALTNSNPLRNLSSQLFSSMKIEIVLVKYTFYVALPLGFEPRLAESKSAVLPLDEGRNAIAGSQFLRPQAANPSVGRPL